MTSGLRVEVGVSGPGECPVAGASAGSERSVTAVSRASVPDSTGRVPEEFTVEERGPDHREDSGSTEGLSEVASYGSETVYRFQRSPDQPCVCERIETFGYPVSDVRAADGALHVSFHAPDPETVREVVTELRDRFDGVRLRKLTRADGEDGADLAFVDRSRLTDRQREVLRAAYEQGYFEHPKGANASEVAETLDISPSTFREHLAAAQRKVLDAVVTA